MTPTATPIEVVAAVILQPDGQFLLTRRPQGKIYSGYWEFPGGKVESGESLHHAIARELWEELGIHVRQAYPWITRTFTYTHATVRLHFFRIVSWENQPIAREQQELIWQQPGHITVSPILPANDPILQALRLPTIYAITHAFETGLESAYQQIEWAFKNGVRLWQIREKQMPEARLQDFTEKVLQMARPYDARVLINGSEVLAQKFGTDGIHLTATRLLSTSHRPDKKYGLCSASCHNIEELAAAEALELDFVVLGPVQPTQSHPGVAALGWNRFATLIRNYPLPVYALGGMCTEDLEIAQEMGAHGIAMMRGIAPSEQ